MVEADVAEVIVMHSKYYTTHIHERLQSNTSR